MDVQLVLFQPIMTDTRNSKINIAARFQNAINPHLLPPIGIFWDIENCHVPKGKSACGLVSAIREKFLKKYREAEFMCVCDINKEQKTIVQELNDAQVTVVHIEAISKNAADEKLRQCMRRFVDTHGYPASLLLISDDVNFATDLSDFRHRHNIQIILLHHSHAPEPLLVCAHEHYDFSEIAANLPLRSPMKVSNSRPLELIVTELPKNQRNRRIQKCLRRLSDNCGGKVTSLSGTKAIIRFTSADAAERAQKRMDKEVVFGKTISVNFYHRNSSSDRDTSPQKNFKGYNSTCDTFGSSASSRDSSLSRHDSDSQDTENNRNETAATRKKPFEFPPPPVITSKNSPTIMQQCGTASLAQNINVKFAPNTVTTHTTQTIEFKGCDDLFLSKNYSSVSNEPDKNEKNPNFKLKSNEAAKNQCPQKNVGRVSPFVLQDNTGKSTSSAPGASGIQSSVCRKINPYTDQCVTNQASSAHCYPFVHGMNFPFSNLSRNADTSSVQRNVAQSHQDYGHPVGRANPIVLEDFASPVELCVSNLDQSFEINELKKILQSVFREHVMVLHISMLLQPDGSAKAIVKLPSAQDAQYAISQLHRKKIGHKRILISPVSSDRNPPFHVLKSEVVSLLCDIPSRCLPLFKFRELYEKRYHRAISVSELYKMRDAVYVQEDVTGRMIYMNLDYRNTPSPTDSDSSQDTQVLEKPYCERHFRISESQGWAEQESVYPLPNVCVTLKILATAVHTLLDSHQCSLPLNSFCACYEAEIGPLPVVTNDASARTVIESDSATELSGLCSISDEKHHPFHNGVPLEHLIACVTGVEIVKSPLCIKKVQWCENKLSEASARCISPALAGQLTLFGREMMDLLKNQPHCIVQFNKFIPTYHHHFGRQCRVADYGFTKLIDLLEAIPHIVQVLGQGQNRAVTLTHRAQIKRFASDLLRILKSRASKQMTIAELPTCYEQCIEKSFDITNYGVCDVSDLLLELSDNVIVVTNSEKETVIGIPKREQTAEEIERTKEFALEVIELLKHTPSCSMDFNKFIPSYHHHFGKQCRVADYGFTKLVELFEAIPDILEVQGVGEEKNLFLTEKERNKILADRFEAVLKSQPNNMIGLDLFAQVYAQTHGHVLRPSDFGASDLPDLLKKLQSSLKIVEGYAGSIVTLVDKDFIHQTSLRIRRILMEQLDGKLPVQEMSRVYRKRYGHSIELSTFQEFKDIVTIENGVTILTPLQLIIRNLIVLLLENDCVAPVSNIESMYQNHFGTSLQFSEYGFTSIAVLLQAHPDYFIVRGRRSKRTVSLTKDIIDAPLLCLGIQRQTDGSSSESKLKGSASNILNEPVPSGVPPPVLKPRKQETENKNLMGFETPLMFPNGLGNIKNSQQNEAAAATCNTVTKPICSTQCQNSEMFLKTWIKPSANSLIGSQNVPINAAAQLRHYTVVHPYNNISPFPNIQTSPVAYYFSPPSSHFNVRVAANSTPAANTVLHPSPLVPVHAVVARTIVPVTEQQSLSAASPQSNSKLSDACDTKSSSSNIPRLSSSNSLLSTKCLSSERLDIASAKDVSSHGDKLNTSEKTDISSSQSTPTKTTKNVRISNRIAAHFSNPVSP